MQVNLSGVTFRKSIAQPKIGDSVVFNHDTENKYDKKAVEVAWGSHFLGYLPKGSEVQKLFFEKKIQGKIMDYSFSRGTDDLGNREFNDENEGHLAKVVIEIEYNHYSKDGKGYRRISEVLSELEHYWITDDQRARLEDWKSHNRDLFKMAARYGTMMHEMAEVQAKTRTGKIGEMMDKHELRLNNTEQTIYDEGLGIAGTYDASFDILVREDGIESVIRHLITDWKTSKTVQEKHKYQVAFYAHNAGADDAWVVLVGANNKQGYSISKVDVNKYYNKLKKYLSRE